MARWLLGLSLLACCLAPVRAQLVTVDAEQGTTGIPNGGLIGFDFGKWQVEGALGTYSGAIVGGGAIKARLNRQWNLKAGDQTIDAGIPGRTDFSVKALARGASVLYSPTPSTRITAFGGMAGGGYASTSMLFFAPQTALGALSIDHFLDPQRRFLLFARFLFSNRQTLLGGMLYQTKGLQTGFTAGTGSNQPHAEGLLNYKNKQWEIRSGYLYSGVNFQLLTLPEFQIAQEDRENIDIQWHPFKQASFTLGRHQYLEPASILYPVTSISISQRGSTDMAGGSLFLHGVGLGASAFESRFQGIYGSAASFYASRRFTRSIQLTGNYYRPLHAYNPMPMFTLNATENLSRKLRLTEFVTHVNGQWSVNYGGGIQGDRFDMDIGYSTSFDPLLAGGGQFQQSMNVNGRVNLGRYTLGVRTFVEPDGHVSYAYEVKSYYYHPLAGGDLQAPADATAEFPSFLIAGMVLLEGTGQPVADLPIRIGTETVYTDDTGAYSLRVLHKQLFKIQLQLDRQIGTHYYEYVSGSGQVTSGNDASPGQAQFVVRIDQNRLPSPPRGGVVIGGQSDTSHP